MMLYRLLRGQDITNLVPVRHYFHSHVYALLVLYASPPHVLLFVIWVCGYAL